MTENDEGSHDGFTVNWIVSGVIGLFGITVIGLVGWMASSLSLMQQQIPLIAFRLSSVEMQLSALNEANRQGARFTAQDGLDLTTFVRRLESRIIAIEQRLPGSHRPEVGAAASAGQGG